jgi:hypothetical protein
MSPSTAEHWWSADPRERFWLEVTGRLDVGADLKFPQTNDVGEEYWGYTLFLDAVPGDVVFHYDKKRGIVGRSIIAGPAVRRPIVWAAKGTSARDKGTVPYERPGWVVPLENHLHLENPVLPDDLRRADNAIRDIRDALKEKYPGASLYFPFELSDKRPLRVAQGYALKLPRRVVELFPGMQLSVNSLDEERQDFDLKPSPVPRSRQGFGSSAAVNRSIELHAMDVATDHFIALGYQVKNTSDTKPYDLLVSKGNEVLTVEVKGTTSTGEKIIVTRNEVDHARAAGNCILFILKNVVVKQAGTNVKSQGGEPVIIWPWNVDSGSLQPISYFYSLPLNASKGKPQEQRPPSRATPPRPQKRQG